MMVHEEDSIYVRLDDCLIYVCSKRLYSESGLLCCGDSTFPGIVVPAVAASGAIVANTLAPVWDHWKLLDRIGT